MSPETLHNFGMPNKSQSHGVGGGKDRWFKIKNKIN
jgi:hypothetical protein